MRCCSNIRAGARRRTRQPRLHRRRGRSGNARNAVAARLQGRPRRGGDDPRLAFRTTARGAHRAGAGGVDRTRARPRAGLCELRRSGHRARRFRRRARPHAGGGRTVLALEIQSAPLRTLRRHSRRRAAPCAHGDQPSAYSRCDDRSAHPRIPHRRERFEERAARLLERSQHLEEFLDALRDFAKEESFPIGLKLLSGALRPAEAGRDYSALAASIVKAALTFIERDFAREHGRAPGGRAIVLGLGNSARAR